ncbi:MAG: hypothetical protein LC624_09795 [Halobacteriales archaeon]|nr:hypothetical protein [Halobacteriales archaeon]
MHRTPPMSVLAVLALALAGCAEPGPPTNAPAGGTPPAASGPAALLANATLPPLALFLQPDKTLAAAPPASEGTVAPTIPVNNPEATDADYPTWEGKLPSAAQALPEAGVPYVFYFTTTSANLEANQLPPFADAPGFEVELALGNTTFQQGIEGPATMRAGETYSANGTFHPQQAVGWEAGTPATFHVVVIYTHVTAAAEFRFVMGPEHPSGFVLG